MGYIRRDPRVGLGLDLSYRHSNVLWMYPCKCMVTSTFSMGYIRRDPRVGLGLDLSYRHSNVLWDVPLQVYGSQVPYFFTFHQHSRLGFTCSRIGDHVRSGVEPTLYYYRLLGYADSGTIVISGRLLTLEPSGYLVAGGSNSDSLAPHGLHILVQASQLRTLTPSSMILDSSHYTFTLDWFSLSKIRVRIQTMTRPVVLWSVYGSLVDWSEP
jgi:hypothetical protein